MREQAEAVRRAGATRKISRRNSGLLFAAVTSQYSATAAAIVLSLAIAVVPRLLIRESLCAPAFCRTLK